MFHVLITLFFYCAFINAVLFISYDDGLDLIGFFDVIIIAFSFFITIRHLINHCLLRFDGVDLINRVFFVYNDFIVYLSHHQIDIASFFYLLHFYLLGIFIEIIVKLCDLFLLVLFAIHN
jgi:hypothetical protein